MRAPEGPGTDPKDEIRHASAVAWGARALLIEGPSGAGKSTLALAMMAHGATLVADDRVALSLLEGLPFAEAPPAIRGLVEARGTGLLGAASVPGAWVVGVARLGEEGVARMPDPETCDILGTRVALLRGAANATFMFTCVQFLKGGLRHP